MKIPESIRQEHLDGMLAMAFDLDDEKQAEQLAQSPDPQTEAPDAARMLQKAFDCAKRAKRTDRSRLMRALTIASCLVLAAAAAVPVALAASTQLRSRVMQMLVLRDDEQGGLNIYFAENQNAAFAVPEGWEGSYFPCRLPEGFTLHSAESRTAVFRGRAGQQMTLTEYDETQQAAVPAEAASYINVAGRLAHLTEGTTSSALAWAAGDRWFVLEARLTDREALVQLAASVRKIIHEP